MKKKLKELIEQRKALLTKIDAILDKADLDKRDMNPDEEKSVVDLRSEVKGLDTKIEQTKSRIAEREAQDELERNNLSTEPVVRSLADPSIQEEGLSQKEIKALQKYSFVRAFNQLLEGEKLTGLEKEMNEEGAKELRDSKVERANGNLIVPQLILTRAGVLGSMEKRDLTATGGTNTEGGFTIATQLGSLIDRLRKKLVMANLGTTMLGGLQGNIAFPKVISDDQAVEKAENAAAAESSATFGQITLAPRRLPVFAEVSRQLLLQTSTDVEAWLRNDLAFQIAQVMDSRAINGSGSSQPFGILNTTGVGAVVGGTNGLAPTLAHIVGLETAVAAVDADVGALAYLTNTKVRGKLKLTEQFAGTNGVPIWDTRSPGSPLNGYSAAVTNLVPSTLTKGSASGICSAAIFGNFNDALMGQWGGVEFLVNPYSRDTEGLIRINCWTFYDFIVRRAESFAVMKDILTT